VALDSFRTTISATGSYTKNNGASSAVESTAISSINTFSYGSGVYDLTADRVWSDRRAASGLDSLDIADLTNIFGDTVSFNSVKSIVVKNTSEYEISVSGMTNFIILPASGCFIVSSPEGWTVGLGDTIDINSDYGEASYDIAILGI